MRVLKEVSLNIHDSKHLYLSIDVQHQLDILYLKYEEDEEYDFPRFEDRQPDPEDTDGYGVFGAFSDLHCRSFELLGKHKSLDFSLSSQN